MMKLSTRRQEFYQERGALRAKRDQLRDEGGKAKRPAVKAWFDCENEILCIEYDIDRFSVLASLEDDAVHAAHLESEIARLGKRRDALIVELPSLAAAAGA